MAHQPISVATAATVAHMLRKMLAEFPPPLKASSVAAGGEGVRPIGSYLLELGYVSQEQLNSVLVDQRWSQEMNMQCRVGDLLIQTGLLPTKVLATVMLMQSMERLLSPRGPSPRFVGEFLLLQRHITPEQLAGGLQMQTWLLHQGLPVRLGDLLVEQGTIESWQLSAALDAQQEADALAYAPCVSTAPRKAPSAR